MEHLKSFFSQACKLILVLLAGVLLGILMHMEYLKQIRTNAETVRTIAIVNMDEGTSVGDEHINYASQLIQLSNENYSMTGMSEAKMGIKNGTYAAYIIIPENFSKAVLSVQNNPEKIVLEYAFNTELDEEVEKKVINDISTFEKNLNTNISFVYIDAILTAFHNVQDASSTILNNDTNELFQLQSVDSKDLIVRMEQPELSIVENENGQIDISTYISNNQTTLNSMVQEYNASIQQGVNEFSNIQLGREKVSQATNDFFVLYQTIIAESENTNISVLEKGKGNLEELINVFNQDLQTDCSLMQTQIEQLVEKQREADEIEANKQLSEFLMRISEIEDISDDTLQAIEDEMINISLSTIEEANSENMINMVTEFSKLFAMEEDRQLVSDTIQTELIDKLIEAQQGKLDELIEEELILKEAIDEYQKELAKYDPFKFLNVTSMNRYLSDISSNVQALQEEVQENNVAHLKYANSVYTTAQQDLGEIQGLYQSACEQMASNVDDCILQLQNSRETINSQNIEILLNFSQLLEYTREGSRENFEVYGHIVEPVTSLENGTHLLGDSDDIGTNIITVKLLIVLIVIIGCVLLIASFISYFKNKRKHLELI